MGEKDKLLILKEPLVTLLGWNKLGSSEEMMQRVMKDLEKHTQ